MVFFFLFVVVVFTILVDIKLFMVRIAILLFVLFLLEDSFASLVLFFSLLLL